MELRIQCLCIDATDPARVASFWEAALGLRPADQGAEVARLQALGARQAGIGQGDVSWLVMTDPDGNEFDVLQPLTPDELPPGHDALGRRIAGA